MEKKLRLGDILIEKSIISKEQLEKALAEQKKSGVNLGQALLMMGFVTDDILQKTLSEQLGLPILHLTEFNLKPDITKRLPEVFARRYRAIILDEDNQGYLVGMVNPSDLQSVDVIGQLLKKPLKFVLVPEKELLNTIDIVYRRTEEITHLAEELHEELTEGIPYAELTVTPGMIDAPVVKLLQSVFEDAVQVSASDIHIEPDEIFLRIRLRVDGILHEQIVKEKNVAPALAMRVKLISGLNMAERRLPQDGRFNIKVRDKIIDVRLSIMPTLYGESIVMRLLDKASGVFHLQETGMLPDKLARFRSILKQPYGMILVTGPTGSGKSTTLNGALNELNDAEVKIITIEDPVEYRISRVNQIQVNEKIGLTFPNIMRSVLRQDPDIIMLGEMRDEETATMAMRAALTGHLVLSTLHTNDAGSSALRLLDMGIQGFMVSATLRCVLAQRLLRKICKSCIEDSEPTIGEKEYIENLKDHGASLSHLKHGKGCNYCGQSGYKGRVGIFELLELDLDMIQALRNNDPDRFSSAVTKALKGNLLIDNALQLAQEGVTTLSEVMRVTGEV